MCISFSLYVSVRKEDAIISCNVLCSKLREDTHKKSVWGGGGNPPNPKANYHLFFIEGKN